MEDVEALANHYAAAGQRETSICYLRRSAAQAAVGMAAQLGALVEISAALNALATAHGMRGLHRERVELARRRLALSRSPGFADMREQVSLLCETPLAQLVVGEFSEALPHLLGAGPWKTNMAASELTGCATTAA
ncbi:MAG: hypothetical protein IT318_14495 [Anaerolineales bacterium]|nr:hypothetical protein [Anaerolineales bacterium]